ncbi:MAG: NFACT RNA binding domain-containing protein [Thermomicrobiales bacterium]
MFDVLTVGAVVEELEREVLDGRIQRIGMVDAVTVAAEVYAHGQRRGLLASATAENPRLLLLDSMPSIDPNLVTPFGLLLRKYLRGAVIVGIEQPPLERIVTLKLAKRMPPAEATGSRKKRKAAEDALAARLQQVGEAAPEPDSDDDDENAGLAEDDVWNATDVVHLGLAVEIMGRHSNLILIGDDGIVMESAKRVTSQMSRVRTVLPHKPYVLPPVPDKPDPRQVTSAGIETLVRNAKPTTRIPDLLVRGLRGVSPQIAREAAFRLDGDLETTVETIDPVRARDLSRIVRELYEPLLTGAWDPTVYRDEDGLVRAYAAIPMGYLDEEYEAHEVSSISAAIEQAGELEAVADAPRDHVQRRARLVAAIDAATAKVESRLHSFREQHRKADDLEALRLWGEQIYAWMWQIQPGDTELVVDGTTIPLDPSLTAKENAQEYFERYRKAQKAGDQLPERIEEAETERGYLRQLRVQAEHAETFPAIEAIRAEFEEHTGGRQPVGEKPGQKAKKARQTRRVTPLTDLDGNLIYIGRSGKENDQVTFDIGGPNDLWLHARGIPGSHVILRTVRPEDEPEDAIEAAAALAAFYSGSRSDGTVEVDVARRRDVRKIKGGGPGMVTYRNEYTIPVRPMSEDDLRAVRRLS